MRIAKQINKIGTGKHLYEIVVNKDDDTISISADSRSKASIIAVQAGYRVLSVNMVG